MLGPDLPRSLVNPDLAITRHISRAIALVRLGNSTQAKDELLQADLRCGDSECPASGEIARARGLLAFEQTQTQDAENFFRKSLAFARQHGDHFLEATALLNLAAVDFGEERYDDSIDWANAAWRTAQPLQARQILEKVAGNLGWAYYKMGNFEASLEQYQQAEQQARELGLVIDRVEWLNNIGLVHAQMDQPSVAEAYYRQSLALAEETKNQNQQMQALTALALVLVQQDRLDEARQRSQQAFALAHSSGSHPDELYPLLVTAQVAARSHDFASAEKIFKVIAADPQSDGWLRWQSRNDLARLFEEQNRIPDADRQYQSARDALKQARDQVRHEEFKLPFQANAVHLYDDYIHFLVEHGRTDQALQEADYGRAQTLAEGLGLLSRTPRAMDPQAVARRAGGVVLYYWLGTRESYLWVVSSARTTFVKLPPAAEIEESVQRYRRVLTGPLDALQSSDAEGRKLYETLIGPVQKLIPRNSRVAIIPDRSLNNLNFETLLAPTPQLHYWIEDVTVSNASSLRMLAAAQASTRHGGGKLLLMGDPIVPDDKFPPLPNAEKEMSNVSLHFPPADRQIYAREQATEAVYTQSRPEQFSYIHFVAHGTASESSPLDSAVVLSRDITGDSYKLHAHDIMDHPLRAELVTISACYGSGKAYTGEGLVGLSWAFLRAGAHNVVGALWEVSDASTPRLMDDLYAQIKQGRSPQDALRAAKLNLLRDPGAFHKPFYWAPFQIYQGS